MASRIKSKLPAMRVIIPGRKSLLLRRVILDFNGTIATDGKLMSEVRNPLRKLAQRLEVIVLTGDTHGTAHRALRGLPLDMYVVKTGAEKRESLSESEWRETAVIGNGVNDVPMAKAAALAIGVLGREGASAELLRSVDIVTPHIVTALELFMHPQRLVATLRS